MMCISEHAKKLVRMQIAWFRECDYKFQVFPTMVVSLLSMVLVKDQGAVCSTESETIGHCPLERTVFSFRQDLHTLCFIDELIDVSGLGHEIIVHHQNGVDSLLDTGSPQGVTTEGLGRSNVGCVVFGVEQSLDGTQFSNITNRCGSSVGVDVIDGLVFGTISYGIVQSHLHAGFSTYTGRSDHVVSVRVGGVSDKFGVDLGSTGLGVLEFFEDHHTTTSGNDESVTGFVKGTGRRFGVFVVGSRQSSHTVEHTCEFPVDVLSCTAEGNVGLVQFDLLETSSDAVGSGTAGTTDGKTGSLNLKVGSKDGRAGGSHGTGDTERSNLVLPSLCLSLDSVAGFDNIGNGSSSLSDNGGNSLVFLVLFGFQ